MCNYAWRFCGYFSCTSCKVMPLHPYTAIFWVLFVYICNKLCHCIRTLRFLGTFCVHLSRFLNRVTISGHIRNSVQKKGDFFPLVLHWFWLFLIIFGKYFLRGLTSKSRREASNEPIFDRLDIFSDAMNLKNTLVLLFRSSDRPQVAYKKSRLFF